MTKTKEKQKEYLHQWYLCNKEKQQKYHKERRGIEREQEQARRATPYGRASYLCKHYRQQDKIHNRGKCTLIPQWIIDNIFTQPCVHCGKTGWEVIGCNRLDNSKPHTPDNVEPCCKDCNSKLAGIDKQKTVFQYSLDGELVAIWPNAMEAEKELGFNRSHISDCCNGKRKTANGYRWSYNLL